MPTTQTYLRSLAAAGFTALLTASCGPAAITVASVPVEDIENIPGLEHDVLTLIQTHYDEQLRLNSNDATMPVFFESFEILGAVSAAGGSEAYVGIAGEWDAMRTGAVVAMRRTSPDEWALLDGIFACDPEREGLVFAVASAATDPVVAILNPGDTGVARLGSVIEVSGSDGRMQVWTDPEIEADTEKVVRDVARMGEAEPTTFCPEPSGATFTDHDDSADDGGHGEEDDGHHEVGSHHDEDEYHAENEVGHSQGDNDEHSP